MSSTVSKINFSQPRGQAYNERIFCYFDNGEIENISIQPQQNDSFERVNNTKTDEIKCITITAAILGGGIGYFITRNKQLLTKLVTTSIGALIGVGTAAYHYAKNLGVNKDKVNKE